LADQPIGLTRIKLTLPSNPVIREISANQRKNEGLMKSPGEPAKD
jgi:hypothetical protein